MAFRVTLIYGILSIILTFIIPIITAILLMEMPPRTMRVMMILWFLPLSGIASTLFWQYLYNENFGIFQFIATAVLGLPPQSFLSSERWVLFWLIIPGVIMYGPGLYYIAGLQSIPKSYYEGGGGGRCGLLAQDLDDFTAAPAPNHLDDAAFLDHRQPARIYLPRPDDARRTQRR